jgi:hypothetical protein
MCVLLVTLAVLDVRHTGNVSWSGLGFGFWNAEFQKKIHTGVLTN